MTAEQEEAVIRVCDDGVGIAPDMLDSVFDLFVQSYRTLDRAAGGLGVGLTLVRSLVAMHGGTVAAHSAGEGKGSEFVVRLLRVAQPVAPAPAPPRRPRSLRERARLVIVEDNTDSRELLCELLEHAGFECRAADNGLAARALIDEFRPDVAILDLGLPGMDGLEVARRLRSDTRHARLVLIALTGYGEASARAAAREAGFDEHVVKPVDGDKLLAMLGTMQGPRTPA